MAERTTFFIVDRKLLSDPIWLKEPFTYGQAWIDLIGRANFADRDHFYKGVCQHVERGQIATSILELSNRWHWSRKKTSRFLDVLEMSQMVSQKRTSMGTTITLENYGFYQDVGTTKGTTKEQQKNIKRTTEGTHNNKVNKENKENNISPEIPSREVVSTFISKMGFNVDADKFCDYYEACEWTDSKGKPIRDWKRMVRTWDNNKPVVYQAKTPQTPMEKMLAELKEKKAKEAATNDD